MQEKTKEQLRCDVCKAVLLDKQMLVVGNRAMRICHQCAAYIVVDVLQHFPSVTVEFLVPKESRKGN